MSTINCVESFIDNEKNHYSCFLIEPLEAGQGITLGNALRRTLLADLSSYAITGVRINNSQHEFEAIPGVREDILEILLNLKEIVFQTSFSLPLTFQSFPFFLGKINVQGPTIITAGMFVLPKDKIRILNPNQYICTVLHSTFVSLEVDIEYGTGYQLTEEKEDDIAANIFFPEQPRTLYLDTLFNPIRKVNYKIKLIHDTKGNIKESLSLEITTNGSVTPQRTLYESVKILFDLFYPLLINPDFIPTTSRKYEKLVRKQFQKNNFFKKLVEKKREKNK